jgi:hypothetical protein
MLENGNAIRVLRDDAFSGNWIEQYVNGYVDLAGTELRIPEMISYDRKYFEYAEVERVNVLFDLREFYISEYFLGEGKGYTSGDFQAIQDNRAKFKMLEDLHGGQTEKKQILRKLRKFFLSTARFESIADFGNRQVAWTGEDWILLDWLEGSKVASKKSSATVFTPVSRFRPIGGPALGPFEGTEKWLMKMDALVLRYRAEACADLFRP